MKFFILLLGLVLMFIGICGNLFVFLIGFAIAWFAMALLEDERQGTMEQRLHFGKYAKRREKK